MGPLVLTELLEGVQSETLLLAWALIGVYAFAAVGVLAFMFYSLLFKQGG